MKRSILILLFTTLSLNLFSQNIDSLPHIAIGAFEGDESVYKEAIEDAISSTLNISLTLLGRYKVMPISREEWKSRPREDISFEYKLDNIITGQISVSENYEYTLIVWVEDIHTGKISRESRVSFQSVMDVFNSVDSITPSIIENLMNEHIALGSASFINRGEDRHYNIIIDGQDIGEDITDLSYIPAGDHSFSIYETLEEKEYLIEEGSFTVFEGENSEVVFSIGIVPPEMIDGMILIEGGSVLIESKEVTVSSFLIEPHEVTQARWREVILFNPSKFKGKNRPVENVNWYEAVEFCNRLSREEGLTPCYTISKFIQDPNNKQYKDEMKWSVTCDFSADGYRLPTEAEWVYAARGGNRSMGYDFAGSNNIEEVAVYVKTSSRKTAESAVKKYNEIGLYDMSGNVSEWCWDWYSVPYTGEGLDPTGAEFGMSRVIRGGSWYSQEFQCHLEARDYYIASNKHETVGLRLVRTYTED